MTDKLKALHEAATPEILEIARKHYRTDHEIANGNTIEADPVEYFEHVETLLTHINKLYEDSATPEIIALIERSKELDRYLQYEPVVHGASSYQRFTSALAAVKEKLND